MIGTDSALTGLAAHGQFAHHDDETDEDGQDQIDYKKREAAGFTHFVGETPNVAQTDSRTDGGQQEAEIASPVTSFLIHESLL